MVEQNENFVFDSGKRTGNDDVSVSGLSVGGHPTHRVLPLKVDLPGNPGVSGLLHLQGQEKVLARDVHEKDVLTWLPLALHPSRDENGGCIQLDTTEAREDKTLTHGRSRDD